MNYPLLTKLAPLCMLVVFAGFLLLSGCGASKPPPTAASQAPAIPFLDESLSIEEYLELGMPRTDQYWSGRDMQAASDKICEFSIGKKGVLPRFQSERSGKMFSRITDEGNLKMLRDPNVPIGTRWFQGIKFVFGLQRIQDHYSVAFNQHYVSDIEMAELAAANLRADATMMKVMYEKRPEFDPEDSSYQLRLSGMARVERSIWDDVIEHIGKAPSRYRTGETLRIISSMQTNVPEILRYSTDPRIWAFKREIASLLANSEMKELHSELQTLYELVDAVEELPVEDPILNTEIDVRQPAGDVSS